MAASACPHCQNQSFEIQEAKTDGAGQPLLFVQCARCGAPAGVVESRAMLLQEQNARLKNLEQQIAAIKAVLPISGTWLAPWRTRALTDGPGTPAFPSLDKNIP